LAEFYCLFFTEVESDVSSWAKIRFLQLRLDLYRASSNTITMMKHVLRTSRMIYVMEDNPRAKLSPVN